MIRRRQAGTAIGSLGLAMAMLAAPVEARTVPTDSSSAVVPVDSSEARAKPTRECRGERATIVGNKKSNLLVGTPRRDVIWAGGGADTAAGLEGKDLICGGRGVDVLVGGVGRDKLYGDGGRDYCQGERREHRHHHGCEMHFDDLGAEVDPPEPPDTESAARSLAPMPTSAARISGVAERVAGAYIATDASVCNIDGPALMDVRLGNVYFQAQYTDPGYIAVLPYYYRWGNSGSVDGPYYPSNWLRFYAPLDGQVYSVDMGATHIPRSDGRVIMMYAVYWWDGAAWVDGTTLQVFHHYLQTTSGPLYTGGVGCLPR